MKDIQRDVLYNQLERLSLRLAGLSVKSRVTKAEQLMDKFVTAAATVEKDTLSTDVRACDNYALLAAHLMLDNYFSSGDDEHCITAISWLEKAIQTSPSTHQVSLLLIYTYTCIGRSCLHIHKHPACLLLCYGIMLDFSISGAYAPIPSLAAQMDVKQILYDPTG